MILCGRVAKFFPSDSTNLLLQNKFVYNKIVCIFFKKLKLIHDLRLIILNLPQDMLLLSIFLNQFGKTKKTNKKKTQKKIKQPSFQNLGRVLTFLLTFSLRRMLKLVFLDYFDFSQLLGTFCWFQKVRIISIN